MFYSVSKLVWCSSAFQLDFVCLIIIFTPLLTVRPNIEPDFCNIKE